jgi:hypothetical protein
MVDRPALRVAPLLVVRVDSKLDFLHTEPAGTLVRLGPVASRPDHSTHQLGRSNPLRDNKTGQDRGSLSRLQLEILAKTEETPFNLMSLLIRGG